MAQHEFGIMEQAPARGERYDAYEPWKYRCIAVDDDLIEPLLPRLASVKFFWHSVDMPGKGLAYCGVTLIPPESIDGMIQAMDGAPQLRALEELLSAARNKNKYVIHFGI